MKLIKKLSQPATVRTQLMIAIYSSQISVPILQNSRELYQRAQETYLPRCKDQPTHNTSPPVSGSFEIFLNTIRAHLIFRRYDFLSTLIFGALALRPVDWLSWFLGLYHQSKCYRVRAVLFSEMPGVVFTFLAIVHFHWRLEKIYIVRSLRLDVISFLLHQEKDIERIYEIQKRDFLVEELTALDRYLVGIICFRFKRGRRTIFRVRPNRTREARAELNRAVARQTLVGYSLLISLVLVFTPFVAYAILSDAYYLRDYPGCYPALEEKYKIVGPSTWSISLWGQKFLVNLLEGIVNSTVWIWSAGALTINAGLVYVINYDLLMYWRNLDKQLSSLLGKLRLRRRSKYCKDRKRCISKEQSSKFKENDDAYSQTSDIHTFELVHLASDFFKRIKDVDAYISRFIRSAVFLWLGCAALISYFKIVEIPDKVSSMRFIHVLAVFLIPFGISTLVLNHKTMMIYQKICSLVALVDRKHKGGYLQLMAYYTGHGWTSYTLLDRHYKPTTLLTLVGWTYSCGIIVDNLTRSIRMLK